MKNLKRLVSIILIASMIFTSNAMITLAENENQVVSSEETTTDDIATVSDADEEVSEDAKLGEPEDGDNVSATETTATTTETTVDVNTETVAENETTVEVSETTVEASETTVEASETIVEASKEDADNATAANDAATEKETIATASDAEEDDNAKTDEEIKIASASTAEIKTNDEETFGAGSVYYAVAGTSPNYALYFSSSDITTDPKGTGATIQSHGLVNDYNLTSARPWDSYCANIATIEILDGISPSSTAFWFHSCRNVTSIIGLDNIDTSGVTNMTAMFNSMYTLTSLDVSGFDTSNVTTMAGMFNNCRGLTTLDLSNFNTSSVTDMSYMFYSSSGLTTINLSSFNTSNVTTMQSMFESCPVTTLDLSSFNTSSVTNMNDMFHNCSGLTTLDLSNFDTSGVTDMFGMFGGSSRLTTLDVSSFNTSNVTNMSGMFEYCNGFTSLDLSSFDTSSVTNMSRMFRKCGRLNIIKIDSARFNTGSVTDSNNMFYDCTNLIGYEGTAYDYTHFDATYARLDDADNGNPGYFSEFPRILIYDGTTKIASASYLMSDIGNTVAEPVKPTRAGDTCVGWYKEQALTNAFNFASDTLPGNMRLYVKWGKEYTLPSGWKGTLTTLGRDFDNDIINITFEKHPTAAPTTSVSHATIPSSNGLELYIVANGTKYDAIIYAPEDGVIKALANCGLLFSTGHVNQLQSINNLNYLDTSNATNMSNMFNLCANLTSLDLSGFDTSKVTNMESMFHGAESLTSLDLSGFDTRNVTTMANMFHNCKRLTSLDVSSFNTSNVTNMFQMLLFCETLTSINVSSFDTSNVTNIGSMFSNCKSLTSLDLSNFDTSNVINMEGLVARCEELRSIDLSSFDTSNVTNMRGMFTFCRALTTLDLSNFNTTSVTNMEGMFYVCQALTSLDLSNFDTSNVTNMSIMFGDCVKLNLIKVDSSKFNTTNVTNSNNMFNNCSALIGFEETVYDASHIDVSYAHIDGGTANPGYFSEFPRIFVYDGTTRLARHDYTMANIGHTVAEPTKPTKTGYYFAGWYKEEALTNEFNFASDVLPGNMFLYVKWTTTPPTPTPKTIKSVDINRTPRRTTYTVGDYIDPTGIVLKVTYDDNTTETITYDRKTKNDFTFKPALNTPLTSDDKEVVITYGKKTVRFSIVVDKKSDPTPSTGGNGGNSGGGSDPTKGPMGDLTKNPEYAKLLDPLANPLPTQPIDQTLNTTNNLPQEDLIYDIKLIDALKSFPENANPTKANVEDTDGNKGYGEWLNVPRTTTWYFLTGNLKPEDVATMSAKESGGFLRSGWYNLGWKGENKWYHFNTGGVMDIGWYTENNLIYYLEADLQDNWYGKAVTGTKVIDGITYNFGTNGALIP